MGIVIFRLSLSLQRKVVIQRFIVAQQRFLVDNRGMSLETEPLFLDPKGLLLDLRGSIPCRRCLSLSRGGSRNRHG